jgi:hypothetical protein
MILLNSTDIKRKRQEKKMKKILSIIALFLIITGCSTVTESPTNQLNVIETWSGYATGRGGDCSDAEVQVKILEDYSIIGTAQATDFNMTFHLKGQLTGDGKLRASGFGGGGVSVSYKGNVNGSSASGTWVSSRAGCDGTWEMAKN